MIITSLENFMTDYGKNRIFRMLELRRVGDWTPREMKEKYIDQDHYVSNISTLIRIVEVIELPDKDVLLGYIDVENVDDDNSPIEYRKLSQIQLSYFPSDEKYLYGGDCEEYVENM